MIRIIIGLLFAALATDALADYAATQGAGTNFGSKVVTSVHYPQQTMCDPTTPAQCVVVDASGRITVLQGTSPWVVSNGGTFAVQAAQSGTWTVQPGNTANTTAWLVTGTGGTFPATQSGTWNITNISGTVSLPTGAATSALQSSAAAAKGEGATGAAVPSGAQYAGLNIGGNLTGLTGLATGATVKAATVAIVDSSGNQITSFGGSGGTAIGDNSAFTQGTTSETPAGCLFKAAYTAATDGRSTIVRCLSDGSVYHNNAYWAGTALGAPSAYGTSPGAVNVPGVNAFVTNTNANGRATAANSSPVVSVAAASTTGNIVANNTTAVVVKASAGTLFGVQVYGIGSAPAYLKIYNATSATCGSGTPVKRLMIPAASTAANGAGSNITFGPGLAMGTGITYCVTTGITDADTTAPAASTFLVNLDYE